MSQWDGGGGGEGRAVEKFRPLRAKIPFRPSPRLLHFFGAPSAIGLLVAAERTGAISQRGSYFTDTGHVCPRVRPRPREAILIGSPPQTQLLSRKCCNKDGREEELTVAAAEFKMPTNKRTYDRDRIAPSLVRQMR